MRIASRTGWWPFITSAALVAGGVIAPAMARAPKLAMLNTLARGAWELNDRSSARTERICVHNGRDLVQIQHRATQCRRFVIDDKPNQVTVQYTCPGDSYGRTSIRRETNRLVQIDSQGIEHGMPFHLHLEGRHVGGC